MYLIEPKQLTQTFVKFRKVLLPMIILKINKGRLQKKKRKYIEIWDFLSASHFLRQMHGIHN